MPGGLSPIEWMLGVALGVWLLLTIATQGTGKVIRWIRQWDVLDVLPMWWFFAPVPGRHDFHLLVRDRHSSASFTMWRELDVVPPRKWWGFLWNPERRQRKAFFDLASELTQISTMGLSNQHVEITEAYLTFLNIVCSLPRVHPANETQFLLMVSSFSGVEKPGPEKAIVSSIHALEDGL
ncbi:MAG: hypothetical protein ABL995_20530 [Bryobacteraceae bacterium]